MPCDTVTVEEVVAELVVTAIDVPGAVNEGEPFDITATVQNTGDVSNSGTVEFTQEGTWIGEGDTGTVPAGSEVDVTLEDHSIEDAGGYEICAQME